MSDDLDFDMEVVNTGSRMDLKTNADEHPSASGKSGESTDAEVPSAKLWPSSPDDWEMVRGSEIYDANPTGYAAEGEADYIEMDALKTDLPDPKYVGRRDPSDYSGQMFAEGDTLFAQITPCTENGKAALVPKLRSEVGIGSTEFIVLSPDGAKVLPRYLYYLSKSHPVHNYAVSRMRGSTGRQRVPVDVFRQELRIPLPPLPEQRKIASVLYAVDQAIQKTEEIIEQAKRVRRGLMQSLMKEGLRDHEFADTATRFGRLPQPWRVKRLKEVGTIAGRTAPEKEDQECWGGNIPWATPSEITALEGNTISETEEYLTERALEKVSSNLLPVGSVLLTTRATVGACAVNTVPMTTNQGFKSVIPGEELDTWYAYYRLTYEADQLEARAKGSTFREVGKDTVENFEIPIPPLEEQREIGKILRAVDDQILNDKETVSEYRRLKKGLMQDLLTGEVRTAHKAIDVLDEVAAHG